MNARALRAALATLLLVAVAQSAIPADNGKDAAPPARQASPAGPRGLELADSGNAAQEQDKSAPRPPASPNDLAGEGRVIFNSNCAHCHGPNAVAGDPEMSLPDLLKGPRNVMDPFFFKAVTAGIPSKGMPTWGGILSHDQMVKILAFLHSVQDQQAAAKGRK